MVTLDTVRVEARALLAEEMTFGTLNASIIPDILAGKRDHGAAMRAVSRALRDKYLANPAAPSSVCVAAVNGGLK